MDAIVAAGYNEAMGARELRRAVVRLVDDALSDAVLRGEVRFFFLCLRLLSCALSGATLRGAGRDGLPLICPSHLPAPAAAPCHCRCAPATPRC